jgi:TM2 domain-containing membrane protein YozV
MEECLVGTELKWFYLVGQEQHGPVSESELRLLLADGTLDQGSKVWSKLLADWMPVAEVALLARPAGKRPSTKPLSPVALRFVGGPRDGDTIKLADQIDVGRSSANDVTLDSPNVSGQHARISRQGASYLVQDLGSTNGTWVNGVRIDAETGISIGDAIHIGSTMIEVLGAGETGPELTPSSSARTEPAPEPHAPAAAPPPEVPPPLTDDEPFYEAQAPAQPPRVEEAPSAAPAPPAEVQSSSPAQEEPAQSPAELSLSMSEPSGHSDFGDKVLDTVVELREQVVESSHEPPEEVTEEPQPIADGRRHRPGIAVAAALLIPGAGQAYNGQVIKAWLLLLGSCLVIPWIYSIVDALRTARRIAAAGGRRGRGGPLWIVIQGWLGLNTVLLIVIVLTVSGVI